MVREHISKIQTRPVDSHKGDYGRVFVVAGSRGMTGAAFLAAQGALRSGCGLVTCGIPESLNGIMEIKLTEAMTLPLSETNEHSLSIKAKEAILGFSQKCDVTAIGPGLGGSIRTRALIKELLEEIDKPVVIDADAIKALEGEKGLLSKREHGTIITPHPGEMSGLMGKKIDEIQSARTESAKEVAAATGAIVCLKGHRTVVANPGGDVYVNQTGNSGMATGGMGDVLTGMVASFVGQGIDAFSAAVNAVYLHGLAGDIAAEKKGPFCVIATDLIESLPEAFSKAGI